MSDPRVERFADLLARGCGVTAAASGAGLADWEIDDAIERLRSDRRADDVAFQRALSTRFLDTLDTLEDLAHNSCDPQAKLAASTRILQFSLKFMNTGSAKDEKKKGKKEKTSSQKSLWDFS